MNNQTELHRMRIDQGGTTAGYVIRQTLSLQMDDIHQLKHTSGIMFIELYAKENKYDIELLETSKLFWAWWCKVWYITDFKLIGDQFTKRTYVDAHTRISDLKIVEAFKQQYDDFLISGADTMNQGGLQ